MIALIDIGNTRVKWAHTDDDGLIDRGHAVHVEGVETAIRELGNALRRDTTRVVAANVAGEAVGAALDATVRERFGIAAEFVHPVAHGYGIRCAYREPARLGVDRWLAMIGAYRFVGAAVCVVQVGTAMTLDVVDDVGDHLGGIIVPGRRLMAETLARSTERIGVAAREVSYSGGLDILGSTTDGAVVKGTMLSLAGAIDRATREVTVALGHSPAVILTGGDADRLLPWLESDARSSADLVLTGLACVARNSEQ
jgi:type III pantothenate kinase